MGAGTSGLQSASILTGAGRGRAFDAANDAAALRLLEDQKHLFADWSSVKTALETGTIIQGRDRDILDALVELDARLDLTAYTATAKRLLRDATNKVNPLEGWTPSVPQGDLLEAHSEQWRAMERVGLREVGKCAFVLVAGGLGERLGYDGIKVSLPTESTTGTCYLELDIKTILAFERRSGNTLPLCLMLSKDTDVATRKLLKENDNFGMRADQISFVVQAGVPALSNQEAHFVLDNNSILCKPHGHGDVHSLLAQSGLPKKWLDSGLKRVFFFQDTNAFALRTLLPALGSAASRSLDVCSTCVERRAGEAMGALCLLKKGTQQLLKNVEYNQLEPLLLSTTGKGDVETPSPYPGNTNQLIIALGGEHGYVSTLERTGGRVPEFVNPKFNANRTFKKPARLECMMQDYPQLLQEGACVGFVTLSRKAVREYAPVKNSPESAIDKVKSGLDAHCASSGEADFYALHGDFLRCGRDVVIGGKEPGVYRGLTIEMPPRIVLSPSFALIEDDIISKVKGVTVKQGGTLIVEGEGSVELEDVVVEEGAALRISTVKGVELRVLGLNVKNAGYHVEAPGLTKAEVIRGFRIVKRDETHLKFEEPGSYAVAPLDLSSDDDEEEAAPRVNPYILGAAAMAVLAFFLLRRRTV